MYDHDLEELVALGWEEFTARQWESIFAGYRARAGLRRICRRWSDLLDFLTVHGAPGFPYQGRRRVLSLRYLSAGATFAPRRWRTSPPFEGLDAGLAAGAELDHPLFPVVWPPGG